MAIKKDKLYLNRNIYKWASDVIIELLYSFICKFKNKHSIQ